MGASYIDERNCILTSVLGWFTFKVPEVRLFRAREYLLLARGAVTNPYCYHVALIDNTYDLVGGYMKAFPVPFQILQFASWNMSYCGARMVALVSSHVQRMMTICL